MNNSLHDSWMSMRMYPPEACETYEVRLADGTTARAFWTGAKWWRNKAVIEPIAWRLENRELIEKAS
jgi:hypothetical protein